MKFDFFSVNHIKAVMSEDSKTFLIHRLKQVEGEVSDPGELQKSEVIMKIECEGNNEKEEWLETIKDEIEKLQSMAFSLSYQL